MVIRIIMIKLTDEFATEEWREAIARSAQENLPKVPGVQALHLAMPADEKTLGSWDLSAQIHFARIEDVGPYIQHPDHRSWVDGYLKPKTAALKAWNVTPWKG